jgi:SAM-dependent methyltransferase
MTDPVTDIYRARFPERDAERRRAVWRVLCASVFQRYVRPADTVLDLAAGFCQFINTIQCGRKIAVDLNEDVRAHAAAGVEVVIAASTAMSAVASSSVDVVFVSNFFEHLPSTESLLGTLAEIKRVLRPGGRLLVLQPNIRLVGGAYWDFVDHHLALTEKTLAEAFALSGLRLRETRTRFLPYTMVGKMPAHPLLVWVYLMVPPAQWLMGKQSFLVAEA